MFHIADFPAMFAAPTFGACQVALPHFTPAHFCEAVAKERINCTVLVPTMMNLLTQFADARLHDLSSLDMLAYGGSPIAPELIRLTRELLPKIELVQVYGLSETGFLTGLQDREHMARTVTSCGRPCPGIDLKVVDEDGRPVETGHQGEFVVRGANVMNGYWKAPEETALAFRNGFFRTGDLGYQDAE